MRGWRRWWKGLIQAVVLASLPLGGAACEEDSCVDVGCDEGQVCNRATGGCEAAPPPSCDRVVCDPGELCDPGTGLCMPRTSFCRASDAPCEGGACFTCPAGLLCDVSTGFCVGACAFANCSRAEVCDERTQECRSILCTRDRDCPEQTLCDGAQCRIGCRESTSCREGEFCDAVEGAIGSCRTICSSDEVCPWGQRCVQEAGQSRCADEPPCTGAEGCRSGEECREGRCRRLLCASDAECGSDGAEYCDLDTGACHPDSCQIDQFEPNDGASTPWQVLLGGYAGLTLCRGEEDWYEVLPEGADPGAVIRAQVAHADEVDLDLELYSDGVLVSRGARLGSPEEVRVPASSPGPLLLRVYASSGTDMAYLLTMTLEAPLCVDDGAEPNDGVEQATLLLPDGATQALVTCPGDLDVLSLSPSPGGRAHRLELRAVNAVPNPSDWVTTVRLGSGAPAPFGADDPTSRQIELAWLAPDATAYATVSAFTRVPWSARLTTAPIECLDEGSGNNSSGAARPIALSGAGEGGVDAATLCPAPDRSGFEADWYVIEGASSGPVRLTAQLRVRGLNDVAAGAQSVPARLSLLTGAAAEPWRGEPTVPVAEGFDAEATVTATLSHLDRPALLRVDGAPLPPALAAWPTYGLSVTATPITGCVEDRSEGAGNDTLATPTPLARGASAHALLCSDNADVFAIPASPRPVIALSVTSEVRWTLYDDQDAPPIASGFAAADAPVVDLLDGVDPMPSPDAALLWVRLTALAPVPSRGAEYELSAQ